jgi:hypothetical protein
MRAGPVAAAASLPFHTPNCQALLNLRPPVWFRRRNAFLVFNPSNPAIFNPIWGESITVT